MSKELLFSITKKDFIIEPFIDSGKGGQNRNKVASCCRIVHPESGAKTEGTRQRSFNQNKKDAFERLVKSEQFQQWYKLECARKLGQISDIEETVNKMMNPKHIKIEGVDTAGKWTPIKEGI